MSISYEDEGIFVPCVQSAHASYLDIKAIAGKRVEYSISIYAFLHHNFFANAIGLPENLGCGFQTDWHHANISIDITSKMKCSNEKYTDEEVF